MADLILTHSDIAAFLACRRWFDWSYNRDFRAPEVEWGNRALGVRVHMAIQMFWKGADIVEAHDALARADVESVESNPRAPGWALNQLYEEIILGRNCCRAFMEWIEKEGPYDGYEIIGVEQVLELPLIDGVTLRGRVDLLLQRHSDGAVFVEDYKTTSRYRAGVREGMERSYQSHAYLALLGHAYPDAVLGGAFYTVLWKYKNPKAASGPLIERWSVPATRRLATVKLAQLTEIAGEILRLMTRSDEMGSIVAFPTPQDRCRWCDFARPCEIYDENPLAARAMLDAEYQRGGRHARYGREEF